MDFTRDLSWLTKSFPISSPPIRQISELAEAVLPTVDAFGSSAMAQGTTNQFDAQGTPGQVSNDSNAVPAGKVWVVPWCSARHDDGVSRHIRLCLVSPDAVPVEIPIAYSGGAQSANWRLPSDRTIVIPPGWKLSARTDNLTAGNHVFLAMAYWELPVGEYIVGVP